MSDKVEGGQELTNASNWKVFAGGEERKRVYGATKCKRRAVGLLQV